MIPGGPFSVGTQSARHTPNGLGHDPDGDELRPCSSPMPWPSLRKTRRTSTGEPIGPSLVVEFATMVILSVVEKRHEPEIHVQLLVTVEEG